jgi:nicotinamidase-related amidase
MKALIVIDMQNDIVNGALGSSDAQKIVPNVKRRIDEYVKQNNIVVYTRDTHSANYLETAEGKKLPVEHCVYGTRGWELVDDIYIPGADIINKPTFGYMEWKKYFEHDDLESIELIGLCTDICVLSNAIILKATFPEVPIFVNASCCAGVNLESHMNALSLMENSCQINIIR